MNWTDEEKKILIENYGRIKKEQLLKLLPNRSKPSISWQAIQLKLKADKSITNSKLEKCKENFFEIPNVLNSYWAGFIAADGNVRNNQLSFYQANISIVQKLKEVLEFKGKITTRNRIVKSKNKIGKTTENSIVITSKKLVDDLYKNFNIIPNKSLILQPPKQLNLICSLSFICGLIDGDGYISIKKRGNHKFLEFGLLGTKEMLEWVSCIFDNSLKVRKRKDTKNTYVIISTHKKARYVLKILDSIEEIKKYKLTRKWNKLYEYNWPCL